MIQMMRKAAALLLTAVMLVGIVPVSFGEEENLIIEPADEIISALSAEEAPAAEDADDTDISAPGVTDEPEAAAGTEEPAEAPEAEGRDADTDMPAADANGSDDAGSADAQAGDAGQVAVEEHIDDEIVHHMLPDVTEELIEASDALLSEKADAEPEAEPEAKEAAAEIPAEAESEEADAEPETEPETEEAAEIPAEAESEEEDAEPEAEPEAEEAAEIPAEAESEEADAEPEAEPESEDKAEAAAEAETEDTTETNDEAETERPAARAWITDNAAAGTCIGAELTLYANCSEEITGAVIWEADTASEDEWEEIGEGTRLTLTVTDQLAQRDIRFRTEEGIISGLYRIRIAEEAENTATEEEPAVSEEDAAEEASVEQAAEEADEAGEDESLTGDAAAENETPAAEDETPAAEAESEEDGAVTDAVPAEEESADEADEAGGEEPLADEAAAEDETSVAEEETAEKEEAAAKEEPAEEVQATEHAEEAPAEEDIPPVHAWAVTEESEYMTGGQVTLLARADIPLDNSVVWQTRRSGSDDWAKAGYGLKLTIGLTEENADNEFRFRLADGTESDILRIHAARPVQAEEAEGEAEEIIEEETEAEEAAEETAEDEAETEGTAEEIIEEETEAEEAAEETAEEITEAEETAEEIIEEETEAAEAVGETAEEITEAEEEAEEIVEEVTESEEAAEETAEDAAEAEETAEEEAEEAAEETADETVTEEAAEEAAEEIIGEESETEESETVPMTEEELTAAGYVRASVIAANGAVLMGEGTDEAEAAGTLETGTQLWLSAVDDTWGAVCWESADGTMLTGYVRLDDLALYLSEESAEEAPIRTIVVSSTLADMPYVTAGTDVELRAELSGFLDTDRYTVQWQYTPDGGETVYNAENGSELTYTYQIDKTNFRYSWRLVLTLLPAEDQIAEPAV